MPGTCLAHFLIFGSQEARIRASKQARDQKYNAKRPQRDGQTRRPALRDRKFIIWDGEGPRDTGYSLLGNSEGDEICYPKLRTADCLQLFLRAAEDHPYAIHCGFGFNYDVSCILSDLPWRCLNALYKFQRTIWRGYKIEHIPRKWFRVSKDGIACKIFDVQSFFISSLVTALEKWEIGPWKTPVTDVTLDAHGGLSTIVPSLNSIQKLSERELVETFKKLRSDFLWKDIKQIRLYMRLELKYTKILMEKLRDCFAEANYIPRSWHGPGAVARMAFARHNIYDVLSDTPDPVSAAARYAFIAGRFELVKTGHIGRVYTADLNSAYPWFCSQLPNLRQGSWRKTNHYEPEKFGIYHIRYKARRPRIWDIHPLPFRSKNGNVSWPNQVTGWYWNPEAELVADNPDATFLEGWVFDEDDSSDRPFAWIRDYFDIRKKLKDAGNPAEYVFKLIINAIYGQLAQRTGWDRKNRRAPKTHQLEYAGWITSACRASVYKLAKRTRHNLVSIDTDGITSLAPFEGLESNDQLGGWELAEYDDSIFWQSGIYALKQGEEWKNPKTRGIPKGTYSIEDLFTALRDGSSIKLTKKVFVTYGLAISWNFKRMNEWIEVPHEYEFGGGPKSKRVHRQDRGRVRPCTHRCGGGPIHHLSLPFQSEGPLANNESYPHKLPWLVPEQDMKHKNLLNTLIFYDRNDLEPEDQWTLTAET